MANLHHSPRSTETGIPPVAGMSIELWAWLRESVLVRPEVVADVREAYANGDTPTADDVAMAILVGAGRHEG